MSEQPPTHKDIRTSVDQTKDWVNSWHQQLRQTYNLTDQNLLGEDGDVSISGGDGVLTVPDGPTYSWRVSHDIDSNTGKASVLQFDQLTPDFNHPLIARIIYFSRNFDFLHAVSFGWRFTQSEVIYESLQKRIDGIRVNKTTQPGVLFTSPENFLGDRIYTQNLELYFGQNLWDARLSCERLDHEEVYYDNGRLQGRNGKLITDYPQVFNPIPHLESFARHKAKLPLIST